MANVWFIRIDGTFNDLSGMLLHYTQKCENAIFYEHPAKSNGNGIHVHGIYENATFAKQTFYDAAKKLAYLKGDKKVKYSVLACRDVKTAIAYMSKGHLEPKWYQGYTKEFIDECRTLGFDKQSKGVDNLAGVLASVMAGQVKEKTQRITTYQMETEIISEYILENPEVEQEGIIYEKLYRITLRVVKSHKKGRYDTFIQRLVEGASSEIHEIDQWARIKHRFGS